MTEAELLGVLNPQMMNFDQRTKYANTSFNWNRLGKQINLQQDQTLSLPAGTYFISVVTAVNLQFTDNNGNLWQVPAGAPFSLNSPVAFTPTGNIVYNYVPEKTDRGVPLTRLITSAAGVFSIGVFFGCDGSYVETTAAGVFVRAQQFSGPIQWTYNAAAGNEIRMAVNAYL